MVSLKPEIWSQMDKIILQLHSQTDLSALQLDFLKELDSLIPTACSFFDLCSQKDGRLFFFDPVALRMDEHVLSAYYREHQFSDYVAWSFASDSPTVYRDSDMISKEARESSAIYKKWMEPIDIYYSMGSTVMGCRTLFGSITLFRSRQDGDFSDTEVEILKVLNRHLSSHFALLWPEGPQVAGKHRMSGLTAKYSLSKREREIMELIAEGCTNIQIASRLFISENTVKKHANNLYRKLGIVSRSQLLKIFYNSCYVVLEPGG